MSLLWRKLTEAGTDAFWRPNPDKLREIVLPQNDDKSTGSLLTFYAGQFEKNYTNVARAGDLLDYFFSRDTKERRTRFLGAGDDGYVPRAGGMAPSQAAAYERALAAAMAQTGSTPLSPYAIEAYRQCAQEVRRIGAAPIFLITPSTTEINVAAKRIGLTGVVMAFNNPRAYPNLFRSSARRDGQHLTKAGAEEFTRIVATNFVELVRAGDIKWTNNQ